MLYGPGGKIKTVFDIPGTPVDLNDLTEEQWKTFLQFHGNRGRRGLYNIKGRSVHECLVFRLGDLNCLIEMGDDPGEVDVSSYPIGPDFPEYNKLISIVRLY